MELMTPSADNFALLVKNCSAVGFYWGSYRAKDPARVRASFDTLLGWVAEGRLELFDRQRDGAERSGK